MNIWLVILAIAVLNACLGMWLVVWRDAMSNPPKPEQFVLEEVTLGDLLSFIGAFILVVLMFPITVMMTVGMVWEEYKIGEIVLWKRNEKPEKDLAKLKKKASRLGFSLTPKVIKGLD